MKQWVYPIALLLFLLLLEYCPFSWVISIGDASCNLMVYAKKYIPSENSIICIYSIRHSSFFLLQKLMLDYNHNPPSIILLARFGVLLRNRTAACIFRDLVLVPADDTFTSARVLPCVSSRSVAFQQTVISLLLHANNIPIRVVSTTLDFPTSITHI